MSEKLRITPGQWRYDRYGYIWAMERAEGSIMLADNVLAGTEEEESYLARMRGIGRGAFDSGEAHANGLLMAAAPDLYATVQRFMQSHGSKVMIPVNPAMRARCVCRICSDGHDMVTYLLAP